MRLLATLAVFVPFYAAAMSEAAADLRVCNRTDSRVAVAIGYNDGEAWTTEGWWDFPAQDCQIVFRGPLAARYYYIYAIDYDQGGEWGGDAYLCTQDKAFTIRGHERCEERGYFRNSFDEIDTGEQPSWTVNLIEPDRQGTGGR